MDFFSNVRLYYHGTEGIVFLYLNLGTISKLTHHTHVLSIWKRQYLHTRLLSVTIYTQAYVIAVYILEPEENPDGGSSFLSGRRAVAEKAALFIPQAWPSTAAKAHPIAGQF